MKNTAILELKKEEKNVLRMRLEYTHTLPAGETQIFVKNA